MTEQQSILNEIHRLLEQQSEAIRGELGPLEAIEYARRANRIRELVGLLNTDGGAGR